MIYKDDDNEEMVPYAMFELEVPADAFLDDIGVEYVKKYFGLFDDDDLKREYLRGLDIGLAGAGGMQTPKSQ